MTTSARFPNFDLEVKKHSPTKFWKPNTFVFDAEKLKTDL